MAAGGMPPPPPGPMGGGGGGMGDPMAALLGGAPPGGGGPMGMPPSPSGGADPLAALLGGGAGMPPLPPSGSDSSGSSGGSGSSGSLDDIRNIVKEEISKALGGGANGTAVDANGKPVKKKGDILGDLLREQVRIRKLLVHLVNSLNVGMPDNILDDDDPSVSSSTSSGGTSQSSEGDKNQSESAIKPIEPVKPAFVQGKQASAPVRDRAEALLRLLQAHQEFI